MAKNTGAAKADTAVKLVLIFFISLLSFSVGTYVGKQFSDNETRRAALEADYNDVESTTAATHTTQNHADEATAPVSDDEVASLTEEFIKKERDIASEAQKTDAHVDSTAKTHQDSDGYTHHSKMKAQEHESAQAAIEAAHAEKHAAKPDAKATAPTAAHEPKSHMPAAHEDNKKVSNAADRVSHDKAPAADVKKAREPSSVLPTVATTAIGKYTVQVASYASENEAKNHASQLTGKGYSAFYVPASVNGKLWYRVSVGLFSDQKSATTFRTELLSTQAVSTAIVQKIVK
jgi:cell division septation protein DedD